MHVLDTAAGGCRLRSDDNLAGLYGESEVGVGSSR